MNNLATMDLVWLIIYSHMQSQSLLDHFFQVIYSLPKPVLCVYVSVCIQSVRYVVSIL